MKRKQEKYEMRQDWQGCILSSAAIASDLDDGSILCEKPVLGYKQGVLVYFKGGQG